MFEKVSFFLVTREALVTALLIVQTFVIGGIVSSQIKRFLFSGNIFTLVYWPEKVLGCVVFLVFLMYLLMSPISFRLIGWEGYFCFFMFSAFSFLFGWLMFRKAYHGIGLCFLLVFFMHILSVFSYLIGLTVQDVKIFSSIISVVYILCFLGLSIDPEIKP